MDWHKWNGVQIPFLQQWLSGQWFAESLWHKPPYLKKIVFFFTNLKSNLSIRTFVFVIPLSRHDESKYELRNQTQLWGLNGCQIGTYFSLLLPKLPTLLPKPPTLLPKLPTLLPKPPMFRPIPLWQFQGFGPMQTPLQGWQNVPSQLETKVWN